MKYLSALMVLLFLIPPAMSDQGDNEKLWQEIERLAGRKRKPVVIPEYDSGLAGDNQISVLAPIGNFLARDTFHMAKEAAKGLKLKRKILIDVELFDDEPVAEVWPAKQRSISGAHRVFLKVREPGRIPILLRRSFELLEREDNQAIPARPSRPQPQPGDKVA